MDQQSSWYGSQTYPYPPQQPPVAADPHTNNAPPPQQQQQQQQLPYEPPYQPSSTAVPAAAATVPAGAQYPYQSYGYPSDPGYVHARGNAPVPASYDYYIPPPGAVPRPPGVDDPYALYMVGNGQTAHHGYPPVGPVYYHGAAAGGGTLAGDGGHQGGFSAKEAIRQFGMHPAPVTYGNLARPPDFFMRQHKSKRPYSAPKKKKKKDTQVMQSSYCEVCKISCDTQEVLFKHKQGRKHKKNHEKFKEAITPKPAEAPTTTAAEDKIASNADTDKDATASDKAKRKSAPVTEVDLETKKRRLVEEGAKEGSVKVCTVCNIVCNSEIVYNYHIAGQKHASMVKKQATSVG